MWKNWAMPSNEQSEEERRLIDEAIAAGNFTRVRPGAAKNDEMSGATKEILSKRRKEFNKSKKEGEL
jgi:hypothetical protein